MSDLALMRFHESYEPVTESGCWIWTKTISDKGYGKFHLNNKRYFAHRWIYERAVSTIPTHLQCDHICRVRCCVNPAHIRLVTSRENTIIGISPAAQNVKKTHCIRGHEFTEENTERFGATNDRRCKTCSRDRVKKDRLEKKPWTIWEARKKKS